MTNQEKLAIYYSLFHGRTDVYPRRWEKSEKSGWTPAYSFDWDEFNAHRARGGMIKNFENKTLIPLTDEVLLSHLLGKETIGVYPILSDNTSYFIIADFDEANWKSDTRKLIDECEKYDISAYSEISRSGNGAHVWIFFDEKYPCWKSRSVLLELIRKTFNYSEFAKEISFDRLFPNQDTITDNGFGNLIGLPLHGERVVHGIDSIVLAFPFSFEGKLIQYIGRLRGEGVKHIIDFHDEKVEFLDRQFKIRHRFYKKMNLKKV